MTRWSAALVALLLAPAPILAQGGGWEIEIHGGRTLSDAVGDGMASVPGPGTPFTTATSLPSRRVPSWFLGDGAALLNGSLAALGLPERIRALDTVLDAPLVGRREGNHVGFRVARDLAPRLSAEVSLDVTSYVVEITEPVAAVMEATSASFVAAFGALLDVGPFTDVAVNSTHSVLTVDATQLMATAALRVHLLSRGTFVPYVTVGGGIITNHGDAPTAGLEGHYAFNIDGISPIAETDRITLTHTIEDTVYFGMLGAGAQVFLTDGSGVRLDVRVHVGRNNLQTLVDATSQVTQDVPDSLSEVIASFGIPSIQFSNNPALGASTLIGADIADFEGFRGRRTQYQIAVSLGYFWRF